VKRLNKNERKKVKLTNRKYQRMDAARSLASAKSSFKLSRARLGLAGLLLFAAAGFAAMSMKPPKLPWVAPLIPTGSWPVHIMVDQATNTAYIANQLDNTISVVDGRNCSAGRTSQCTPIATISPGPNPTDLILDAAHRTLFATLAGGNSDSIAVIDISSCNATNTSGCTQTPKQVVFPGSTLWQGGAASVPFGFPSILDLDETTHTLYVPDANEGPIYILDTSTCNGGTPTCSSPIITAAQGDGVVVERAHHSVFILQAINFSDQVQILDSSTCNSTNQSGCGTPPSQSFTVSFFPNVPATVDEATHTLYTPSQFPNILAVIDTSVCNASTTAGCGSFAQVQVGSYGFAAVFDPQTRTVYVENFSSTSMSVVNGATCNAMNHSGCNQKPPVLATGIDPAPFGYNPAIQTLYVSSQDTNFAWVLDGSKCNATRTDGCTRNAPTTPTGTGPSGLDINPNTTTLYVGNQSDNTVSVIDTSVCNQHQLAGCNQTWQTAPVGSGPFRLAVNKTTNTVYVAAFDRTLSVINGATCNATVNSSCNQPQPSTLIGNFPNDLAIDEITNTIYVANRNDDTVSIVDGTHCQGSDASGCGQSWPTFNASRPQALAFNPSNRTLYVANGAGDSVWIIDTSHCNNHDATDCTAKAVVPVDSPAAIGILFDRNSVFVVNRSEMSVSIFDGATCNATNVARCTTSPPPAVSFAVFPDTLSNPFEFSYVTGRQIVIDQEKHTVFIPTLGDTDLVVLNGDSCLPDHLNGCKPKIANPRTGGTPDFAAVDPSSQTVYVGNLQENTISIAQDNY
jgi:YVTN family beta-propeller protein